MRCVCALLGSLFVVVGPLLAQALPENAYPPPPGPYIDEYTIDIEPVGQKASSVESAPPFQPEALPYRQNLDSKALLEPNDVATTVSEPLSRPNAKAIVSPIQPAKPRAMTQPSVLPAVKPPVENLQPQRPTFSQAIKNRQPKSLPERSGAQYDGQPAVPTIAGSRWASPSDKAERENGRTTELEQVPYSDPAAPKRPSRQAIVANSYRQPSQSQAPYLLEPQANPQRMPTFGQYVHPPAQHNFAPPPVRRSRKKGPSFSFSPGKMFDDMMPNFRFSPNKKRHAVPLQPPVVPEYQPSFDPNAKWAGQGELAPTMPQVKANPAWPNSAFSSPTLYRDSQYGQAPVTPNASVAPAWSQEFSGEEYMSEPSRSRWPSATQDYSYPGFRPSQSQTTPPDAFRPPESGAYSSGN